MSEETRNQEPLDGYIEQAGNVVEHAHSGEPIPEFLEDVAEDFLELDTLEESGGDAYANAGDSDDDAYDDEYDDEDGDDEEDDGSQPVFMQNRELSWLTFNERVLDQGADESVPLLERLNFISIFWSNLQEFFMVRVGSLTDLLYIEPPAIDSKTGMTPDEQIRAIHERCHELYPIQESHYEHLRGQLAKEGVRHLRPDDLSEEQRNYLFGLVKHNVEPFLSPQIINARHPFPHLENGKLYILVRLDDEVSEDERKKKKKKDKKGKKEKGGAEGVVLGLIPLPHQCERVIKLPGRGFQFILLEHAIEMFVPEIFSMYKIKHTNVICVTRNADIDANQGFDEQDEDYREHMKRLLKQRARLAPVRLECERPLSPVMEKVMLKKLGLKRHQMYDTIVPLDLSYTWGLGSKLSEKKCARLSNPPFNPAWPAGLDKSRRIMDQVAEKDVLLSYPYESIDSFVQLLREAANDPDVISIKITLYRLASQSHIAEALIAAADAGKEVTALFELRARFDENNNIEWSQRFEQAGCNVLYGFRNYKVHSKICCITRRTAEGGIQHITQLGTGNYNEKTARLYTDFAYITTKEEFGQDAVEFFRNMQLENVSDDYETLSVAPLQIKSMILDNLDAQIERAQSGLPASAFMKANSITDKEVIEKISEASNAGVRVTLFIRGICCLIPHVKGATENVRVVSIVGRLLEHSRIYCFGPAEDCVVYLSSADLMTRNLNKRVEIAWPLPKGEILEKVLAYIDVCMRDTAKLRELRPNATYTPLGAFCDIDEDGNPEPSFDAQAALIKQAAEAQANEEALEEAKETEESSESIDSSITAKIPVISVPEVIKSDETTVDEPEDEVSLTNLTIEEILSSSTAVSERAVMPEPAEEPVAMPTPAEEPAVMSLADKLGNLEDLPTIDISVPENAEIATEDSPKENPVDEPAIEAHPADEQAVAAEYQSSVVAVEEDSKADANPESQPAMEPTPASGHPQINLPEIDIQPSTNAESPVGNSPETIPPSAGAAEETPLGIELPKADIPETASPEIALPSIEDGLVTGTVNEVSESFASGSVSSSDTPGLDFEPGYEKPLEPLPTPSIEFDPEKVAIEHGEGVVLGASAEAIPEMPVAETVVQPSSNASITDVVQDQNSNERVSELISKLSATQGQDVPLKDESGLPPLEKQIDQHLEQSLTDMTIDEILQPSATLAPEPDLNQIIASQTVAETPTAENPNPDVNGLDISRDTQESPAAAETNDVSAAASQGTAGKQQMASETATTPTAAATANNSAKQEEVQDFFEDGHREIEMPPDKKQGFFSRFRK